MYIYAEFVLVKIPSTFHITMKSGVKYDLSGTYEASIPRIKLDPNTAQPITLFNTIETQIAHPESSSPY